MIVIKMFSSPAETGGYIYLNVFIAKEIYCELKLFIFTHTVENAIKSVTIPSLGWRIDRKVRERERGGRDDQAF